MWARDTAVIVNTLEQSTTLQLAAYCVLCFLRQCMCVLTISPPTPPSSFVSQGLRGQRLFGWPYWWDFVFVYCHLWKKNSLYRFMRLYTVPLCGCFMRVLYAMAYTTLRYMCLENALCQALCVMD